MAMSLKDIAALAEGRPGGDEGRGGVDEEGKVQTYFNFVLNIFCGSCVKVSLVQNDPAGI